MPPDVTGMAGNGGANMAGDGRGDIAGARMEQRYTNESRRLQGERLSLIERRGLTGAKPYAGWAYWARSNGPVDQTKKCQIRAKSICNGHGNLYIANFRFFRRGGISRFSSAKTTL
jgi:hypothetical protein